MRSCSTLIALAPVLLVALAAGAPLAAQQPAFAPRALTAADYERAEKFLAQNANRLVLGGAVRPTWLDDGRFWYANRIADGIELVVVDPARGTRARLFDQARMASALTAAAGKAVAPFALRLVRYRATAAGETAWLAVDDRTFACDVRAFTCTPLPADSGPPADTAPDGRKAAFIRGYNLWVRDLATGKETQLTTDGAEDYGYATDNAGWIHSDRPILLWSPDSRKIATFQQDQRHVGMMYLVHPQVGHPKLDAWRYPLPGDSVIPTIARVVIELEPTPRVVRLKLPPDPHRTTFCDDISCSGDVLSDAEWYPDGSHLAFVSSARDHKRATLRVADAATGDVRDVLTETAATQFESGIYGGNWRVVPALNEAIWFSERSDWGQLYLYDLRTGRLERPLTTGTGQIAEILRVDPKERVVYFTAVGREPGRDPYFRHLYRVALGGGTPRLLTPENADHDISMSRDGRWIVDNWSTPETPPVSVLRDPSGRVVKELERTDVSRLVATGWTPPMPFTVKARDGKTDLYGLLFRPTAFDSTKRYPIVNNIYPGPQVGSVGSRSFVAARGDARALAELGFIVVQIDALGTPLRSKSFHDAWYGDMGDNGLADQVAGMKQLAQRYPWIDLERAGIWGHSGGGYATADAMLRFPDFFKAGVSEAGNHDNREYEDDWGERYQGLLTTGPNGTTNYDNQANQLVAANLKGKLLIAYGTGDDNVPPYNSLLLIDELIRHNRDFDVLPLPNRRHGFTYEPYMIRRRWDYLVKNVMGAEPPTQYELKAAPMPRRP